MSGDSALRLIPLGGLGEVGMNCMMIECGPDAVIVDCGVMFPEQDVGVDVVHPLFDHLVENRDRIRGLVLTHGHEDHIGSVPYFLQYMNVPIYGTDFTLRLVQERLTESELPWQPKFVSTNDGGPFPMGCLEMSTVAVNHSIPQATSVVLNSPAGTLVHTSDFKVGSPGDPDAFDRETFERLGREGVALLLSDSTNIEKTGMTGHEASVQDAVREIVEGAKRSVFVTLFPSNVRRLAGFIETAQVTGRKVVLVGRSVERYAKAAQAMGILDLGDDVILPQFEARRAPDSEIMYVVAGTQGEPRSAMAKIARGEHHMIKVRDGDTVIFSSRRIPGNEMRISAVIDDLARCGAVVNHMDNSMDVHVSGHAHRGDLQQMLELTRPEAFIPVHGNYHYLTQHAQLARQCGIDEVLVVENGDIVQFSGGSLELVGKCPAGKVHVDGSLSLSERILSERKQLSDSGIVIAVALVERGSGRRLDEPRVHCHGVFDTNRFPELEASARDICAHTIDQAGGARGGYTPEGVRREGRKALKRFFSRSINRHPVISFLVVEVAPDSPLPSHPVAGSEPT